MATPKKSNTQAAKSALKVLKRKGLYSGDLRKAPTDYAKRLARKYSDVVSGSSQVISVPRHATKRSKGVVAARKEAQSLAEAYGLAVRSKGAHLIVKTVTPEDRVIYSPRKKLIEIERQRTPDLVERIELRKHMEISENEDGTLDLSIRKLRDGESYVIPFGRGRGGIQYLYFGSKTELMRVLNEYSQRWGDMSDFVSIARLKRRNSKRSK